MILYTHKKTGKLYRWLSVAVDCTNSRNGASVVVYCPDDNENTIYVRETTEFHEKFALAARP